MIHIKNVTNHFIFFRSEINKITSIKGLIKYISIERVRLVALYVCLLWIISPIYIMAKSIFLDNHTTAYYYFNHYELGLAWYILLQQLGITACLIAILMGIKEFLSNNLSGNYLGAFIQNHFSAFMMLILLSWTLLSTVFSDKVTLSIHGTIYRRDGLISYIAYAGIFSCGYLLNDKQSFQKVLKWFVWTSSFLALLMLLDIEYINRLFTFHPNSTVFYNINHFAYYLCMAIMSTVAMYMMEIDSDLHRKQYMLCFIVLVAALVKNKSFGPYLAVVAGLIFTLIVIRLYNRKHIKDIVKITIIFVITSFIMNLFYGVIGTEIIKLFSGINDIIQETETAAKAGSGRWEIWTHGLKFVTEKPVFGYGPENLGARYLAEGISHDRPHNEFIQIAASLGIPALLFYLLALLKNFSILFLNRKSLTITIISLNAIIATYIVSSFFGNTMFYTSPFYFMLLGITMGNVVRWEKTIAQGSHCPLQKFHLGIKWRQI